MYYDTYRGKKRRRKEKNRPGCLGWLLGKLLGLLMLILVLALLAAGLLYVLPAGLMNIEPAGMDLSITKNLPVDRVNILLLGLDFEDDGRQRSDAIMIASVGDDGMKLTSVMRDTIVDIPGHGLHKLNSAYSYGGAEMVMRVVNKTFGLNITNYAIVDLRTLVDAVDAVGGVQINVNEKELPHVNRNAWDTYKKISALDGEKYSRYASTQPLTQTGDLMLNGIFATGYSRIRAIDSDYMRTARQREVISAAIQQMRSNWKNPAMYIRLMDVALNSIETNLAIPELISLGEKVLVAGKIESLRFPMDDYITDTGSQIEITDPAGNIRSLYEFIYN